MHTLHYSVTGERRKALVRAVSEILFTWERLPLLIRWAPM